MRHLTVIAFILLVICHSEVVSQPCLPDGITFTTQAQIDSFQIIHPNCTEIEDDVVIIGNNIINLIGLNVLTSIGDELWIKDCDKLHNLSGLVNLNSVGGRFLLQDNDLLTNLMGLQNLSVIGGYLDIVENQGLQSLTGLDSLSSVGSLGIAHNNALSSLESLDNLSAIKGSLLFFGNDALKSLLGLSNIISIDGSLTIQNTHLKSLSGLNNLDSIWGLVYINKNDSLLNFLGMEKLTYIQSSLGIYENDNLISLQGLEKLNYAEVIEIWDNDAMTNILSLANLNMIGGFLIIGDNDILNSLKGIDNISPESIEGLMIENNNLLSMCETQSICDYLGIPNSYALIANNKTDCNTRDEIESACVLVSIYESPSEPDISIFPNPFTTSTTIEYALNGNSKIQITIYNMVGEAVYQLEDQFVQGTHQFSWSPHHLPAGMYFVVLRSEEGVSVVKMVKE